jgi:hypothetical protein
MGDEPDDAALTQSAPTELGEINATEANAAWSLADDLDENTRGIYISPRVLTAVAVAVSLAAVIGASAIVGYYMHDESAPPPANEPTATTSVAAPLPPPPPSPTPAAPAPASPTTVTVRQPPPPTRSVRSGTFSTYVSWAGAPCIQIRFPNSNAMPVQTSCDPTGTQVVHHTGVTGELIGADPIMGQATKLACRVMADATQQTLIYDEGTAGDGHDVTCITAAP